MVGCAGSVKACYGHSEGSAGAHGALLALSLLSQHAAAPIMHLRNLNPYVEAAFADTQRSCHASTLPPRVSHFLTELPSSGLDHLLDWIGMHLCFLAMLPWKTIAFDCSLNSNRLSSVKTLGFTCTRSLPV